MAYQPIENYGLIGDMRTAAMVGLDGSIDWLCVPRFDSPTVFARLLDDAKGGFFSIRPTANGHKSKQLYWPDTNVLMTRFFTEEGGAELTDFMPVGEEAEDYRQLIRRVTAMRGEIELRMECQPAFNYARDQHETRMHATGVEFASGDLVLALASATRMRRRGGGVGATFTLKAGESAVFVLREVVPGVDRCHVCLSDEETERLFRATERYWRRWISRCTYTGRWREAVHRSALALKLLTYEPTGAIIAAATCGLPEDVGGERNWDYRYTWIRDSAFTVYALLRLGFAQEAADYIGFLERVCRKSAGEGPLQVMYGVGGERALEEETLDHLDGYRGSRPVRIGNAAYGQLQLDIYGELMDAAYLHNKWGMPISADAWRTLRDIVDWVCGNWTREDQGVWELRGAPRHFVYSKLMCWVAVDRGLRLADKRSFPCDRERWLATRDEIYQEIHEKGWNEDRQAFVHAYGDDALDAANLMMPLVFFLSPNDPRMLSTLDAILEPPSAGGLFSNSMVRRYDGGKVDEALHGEEGTFNICTFWLVEALTRAGRFDAERLENARLIFDRMLGFANHVGLYSEETGDVGEALGNVPQAFTHLALISAAYNLDRTLDMQG